MKSVFFSFVALIGAAQMGAQTVTPLEQDSLREVVVSANKIEEQKRDLSHQVEVISRRQIEQLNPLTTADALEKTGEVFIQKSQQGGGSPVLRGFEANKVLLVVDGVRMNNAIYRGGHLQNVITLDPNALERIEVLHGAGSVIYGTDAIGGVISAITRRPKLSISGKREINGAGMARYTSANQGITANFNMNIGGSKWANFFAISANDFGDLRSGQNDLKEYPNFGEKPVFVERINGRDSVIAQKNPDLQKFSGYQQIDILEKLLYAPSLQWRHLLNLQVSRSTEVPRYDRLTELSGGLPRFAEWYYGPQNRLMVSYQAQYTPASRIADQIRLTSAYQQIEESRFDRRLYALTRNERTENLDILSFNLEFFKNIAKHELRYGAEFVQNQLQSRGLQRNVETGATTPSSSRYPDGTYQTQGVFVAHHWEILGKKLILTDGLRLSAVQMAVQFDSAFFTFAQFRNVNQSATSLNFQLGLVSNQPSGFRIATHLSSGFRNPNIDDAGKIFENANQTLNLPNPALKPEQVINYEITLGQDFGTKAQVSVTGYVSQLSDAIATRATTYLGQNYILFQGDTLIPVHSTNVAQARVLGFSLHANANLGQYFRMRGSVQYAQGRDLTDDVPLDHIPPLVANLRLAYETAKWQIETDVMANGWKRLADYSPSGEDNLQYATPDGMPAWAVWNLRGSWSFKRQLQLQAGIENILDLNYRTFASGINGSGRNMIIALRAKF